MPVTSRKLVVHKVHGGGKSGPTYRYDHSSGRATQAGCELSCRIPEVIQPEILVVHFTESVSNYPIPSGYSRMNVILVGSGGGGGGYTSAPSKLGGGGGGGGGYLYQSNIPLVGGTMTITINPGGSGGISGGNGNPGSPSIVSYNSVTYIANGGGGGHGGLFGSAGGIGGTTSGPYDEVYDGINGVTGTSLYSGVGGNSVYPENELIGRGGDGGYPPNTNGARGSNGLIIVSFHN